MAKVKKQNETMYVMCQLSKDVDGGVARMTSWIRQAIAVPGNVLDRLEDTETGCIQSGWRVETASGPALPEGLLTKNAHDYDKMKRRSDI